LSDLKDFLDSRVRLYNDTGFIETDPISIPHLFTRKQDIEIAGLFAAVLAWGQRITIIKKSRQLMEWMDHSPYDFILNHQENDLKKFTAFKHRTFNATDLLYFLHFLQYHYNRSDSLEEAFSPVDNPGGQPVAMKARLISFHEYFFSLDHAPTRTRKHISTPVNGSACKRLNMYLRWMVRKDLQGVDFGIWKNITPDQLICPLDVHVERVARKLKLIQRKQTDWKAAKELTNNLKKLDPEDPVKYDYALFGLGVIEKFI